jgi:hypothetical protein
MIFLLFLLNRTTTINSYVNPPTICYLQFIKKYIFLSMARRLTTEVWYNVTEFLGWYWCEENIYTNKKMSRAILRYQKSLSELLDNDYKNVS